MPQTRCLRVITRVRAIEMCAEYCAETGRLRLLRDGAVQGEWFPPNSWMTIASVSGARTWGTGPSLDELRALLEHHVSTGVIPRMRIEVATADYRHVSSLDVSLPGQTA
jgi:hypothetical protein